MGFVWQIFEEMSTVFLFFMQLVIKPDFQINGHH